MFISFPHVFSVFTLTLFIEGLRGNLAYIAAYMHPLCYSRPNLTRLRDLL